MLDADMNYRYWSAMTRKYGRREVGIKIFLALMSSGTVAAWGFWFQYPEVWKGLSAISAVVAIASPILNFNKSMRSMSDLAGQWQMHLVNYEELVRSDENLVSLQSQKKFSTLKRSEGKTKSRESSLPKSDSALKKAFNEVKVSRGLV